MATLNNIPKVNFATSSDATNPKPWDLWFGFGFGAWYLGFAMDLVR